MTPRFTGPPGVGRIECESAIRLRTLGWRMFRRILFGVATLGCVLPVGGRPQVSTESAPKAESKPAPKPGVVVAEEKPNPEPELGVMTVADVLLALQLDESRLQYIDEPPGKLRELRAVASLRGSNTNVVIRISVVYTFDLMSITGTWESRKVRAAKVSDVTITGK
jgi:hypothetical protein